MRISSKRCQRDPSLFPFHLSAVTRMGGVGGVLRKTTVLSTASAASARGQTEEEAALNVREWIREADYASEVRAEQSERKRKSCSERTRIPPSVT